MNVQKLRLPIDIAMTLLSIILMGGAYLFPADIIHEILGVALFALWAVPITLNRRWFCAMGNGRYNARRILQTVINCCILVCTILLMISGTILSNHLFTFLNIQGGLGFARIAHLLASHWYYLFMSLHIGLHVGMITNKMRHPAPINSHPELVSGSHAEEMPKQVRHNNFVQDRHDKLREIIPRIILALVCAYGIYAFIARGVWKYLILQQQFFFFDLERSYILFAVDYISIIILFATISHFVARKIK